MEFREFNKTQCISNIRVLAKDKGIKLGQLETAAGVSPGYLSRMDKEDSNSTPSIEMLYSVAQQLDVSLDLIVAGKYDALTDNEMYMISFIEQLIKDTINDELDWKRENLVDLDNIQVYGNGETSHPLFIRYNGDATYNSSFSAKGEVQVRGDIVNACVQNEVHVYVVPVEGDVVVSSSAKDVQKVHAEYYEVYIVENGFDYTRVNPLCATMDIAIEITNQVERLYDTVLEVQANLGLDKHVKSILAGYMDRKKAFKGFNEAIANTAENAFAAIPEDDIPF